MAFEWLAQNAGNISGIAKSAGSIFDAFFNPRSASEIPFLQQMVNNAEAARVYSQASGDPNSPYFQNQAALMEEQMRRDLIAAINADIRQTRRARARGDLAGQVTPERRDEARASAIAQGNMDARQQARIQARNFLQAMAQSMSAANQAYPLETFRSLADARYGQRQGGFQALGDLAGQLGGLFGKQPALNPQETQRIATSVNDHLSRERMGFAPLSGFNRNPYMGR